MERKEYFGRCGLACFLCSENIRCRGCASMDCPDADRCENRRCSLEKGIAGCYACGDTACRKGMLQKSKPLGFTLYLREHGCDKLTEDLRRNEKNGVVYHSDGITGDYDVCGSTEELFRLIASGKKEGTEHEI